MRLELIGIKYSPWTHKARWVLDHHGLQYKYSEHLVMVGLPLLRFKMSRWAGEITVPSLIGPNLSIFDSFVIARWVDQQGGGTTLFPTCHLSAIEQWNQKSEVLLNAARMLTTRRLANNNVALTEVLPPYLRPLPGSLTVARMAARYVLRNYSIPGSERTWLETLRTEFIKLREELGKRDYILGEFTFADIAMATSLQAIQPPDPKYVPLGPASQYCWTRPNLVKEFSDLLQWRVRILEKHGHTFWI